MAPFPSPTGTVAWPTFLTSLCVKSPIDELTIKTPNPKCHLYWYLNRVYRMEIQSVMLVFSTQLCELLPLLPSLWFKSPPIPPSLCEYVYCAVSYTRIQCACKGGGICGSVPKINNCRKDPLQVNFFLDGNKQFALPSMSLIFLRASSIYVIFLAFMEKLPKMTGLPKEYSIGRNLHSAVG
jgi:hypothetical protein